MLKINLLPPYINQRSKIRTAWTLMAAGLAALLVGLTLFQMGKRTQEQQLIATVEAKEAQVVKVEQLATEAQQTRAQVAPIKAKTDFINELFAYNRRRPDLYDHVASYIYREVWISGMQAEQNVLTMPASGKSISSVGRFLLFMQNNPDFTQVRISSVPGWPPGTAGVEAGPLTGEPGAGGYGGASTGGGLPGGPPGGPGGYGPPGGAGGYGGASTGGGPPGGPPGYGAPSGTDSPYGGAGGAPPIFGGGAATGGDVPGLLNVPGGPGGLDGQSISAGGAPIPYPTEIDRPRPRPTYFPFTVTAILVKPIIRPTYGGDGAEDPSGYGSYGASTGGYGPPGGPGYGGPPGFGPGGPGGPGGPYGSAPPAGSG